jgi:hypothetical protein
MRHSLWKLGLGCIGLVWASFAHGAEDARPKTYTVAGQVRDAATGQPIEGATVSAELYGQDEYICKNGVTPPRGQDCKGNPVPLATPVETATDAEGRFAFTGVPRHEIELRARKENYTEPPSEGDSHGPGDSVDLNITDDVADVMLRLAFVPKTSLSGMLRDASGAPIAGASVAYRAVHVTPSHRPPLTERGSADVKTGKDGSYRFDHLAPGPYYLIALYPGTWGSTVTAPPVTRDAAGNRTDYAPIRYPAATLEDARPVLSLKLGEAAKVDLRFPGRSVLHHVAGKGVERDAPAEGPHCFAFHVEDVDGDAAYRQHAFTPAASGNGPLDKRFEAWLPDGVYHFQVRCQACAAGKPCTQYAGEETLRVAGADVTDLALPFGPEPTEIEIPIEISRAFKCQGADAMDCMTPPLDSLSLNPLDTGPFEANPIDVRILGDAKPTAKALLRPGTYGIDLQAWRFAVKSITSGALDLEHAYLTVEAGKPPPAIDIVLERGATLKGRVLQAGRPVAGEVYVVPHPPKLLPYTPPRPNHTDGTFQIGGRQAGAYYIFACDRDAGLDFRDPATLDRFVTQWRKQIKDIALKQGDKPSIDLDRIELSKAAEE